MNADEFAAAPDDRLPAKHPHAANMIWVPGGTFLMGSKDFYPEEAPTHQVSVDGFWMDQCSVTNEQFNRFVDETAYVTVAERPLDPADYPGALPELLVPGGLVFVQPQQRVDLRDPGNWWAYVPGADWRHPYGPTSSIAGRESYPVTQVAYDDAQSYAAWAGKSLPTEAEWEFAARGGLEGARFVWGDEYMPGGAVMANTWHGEFPWQNLRMGRNPEPMPVGSFPPNGYGLYDMAGNVWEWTSDWFAGFAPAHRRDAQRSCCIPANPRGASIEQSYDPAQPKMRIPRKVLKGGSYLCAPNYCLRYRPAARSPEMVDTSTCHISFRCVVRVASTVSAK
ncbi:MAG: formylglycine-generating enzyme family protein [Ktedonobacterales bacterium]